MANWLSSFLHPEEGYEKAEEAANQGWNQAQGFQQPFMQHGLDQYQHLNDATGALLDPEALQNKWASGYETSPYAQQLLQQNRAQGMDEASQYGLNGSSAAIGNIQQRAGNIVSQDRQQYLNDLMQKYMTGIGLGQNLYGVGAQAGQNLGNQSFEHGNNMAGLEYGRQNAPGQLFGQVAGAVGTGLANYATGGGWSGLKGAINVFNS